MSKIFDSSKKRVYTLFICSIILIFATYSNHFYNEFHFDDSHVVQNNLYIRNLSNIPHFFTDAKLVSSLPENQQYRPLVATTLALDYAVEKDITRPFWFHVSMFVWFLVQCIFLFVFLLTVANQTRPHRWNPFFALGGMTLYGVHTANAETINYISARSDSMSTCWLMIALVTFIKWPQLRKWGAYILPWIVACLFKQTAVVFPALVFFYVLFFEQQQGLNALFKRNLAGQIWRNLLKQTAIPWIFGIGLIAFLKSMDPSSYTPGGKSVYLYLITQPFVMLHYFFTFFLPLQLSADTDWTTLTTAIDDRFFVGFLFIVLSFWAVFSTSKKQEYRPIAYGLLWFFITLLPTSSVIPLAEVMNDHRLFFPFIGLTLSTSFTVYFFWLQKLESYKKHFSLYFTASLIAFVAIITCFSYGTYQRNKVWATEETLWKDVTIKSPKNGRGLMSYGLTMMAKGNYFEAKRYFLEAEKLIPYYPILMINLGILYDALDLEKESVAYFEKAIQYGPKAPDAYLFYGKHYRGRDPERAEKSLRQCLTLSPGKVEAYHELIYLYWEQENWEKLGESIHMLKKMDPSNSKLAEYEYFQKNRYSPIDIATQKYNVPLTPTGLLSLSNSFSEKHIYTLALKAAERALSLDTQSAEAYASICSIYIKMGQYKLAQISCEQALLLDPNFLLAKNNLEVSIHGQRG